MQGRLGKYFLTNMVAMGQEKIDVRRTFEEINNLKNTVAGIHRVIDHLLDTVIGFGKAKVRRQAMTGRSVLVQEETPDVNESAIVREPSADDGAVTTQCGEGEKERNKRRQNYQKGLNHEIEQEKA